jgi:hypothetical protein
MNFKRYILLGLMVMVMLTGCGNDIEWFPGTTQQLAISTKTLPNATIGTLYSMPLLATGGKTPYVWTLDSGTLPAGLTLNPLGWISGTPTAASTTQTFSVKVTDSASPNVTATQSLTITIPGTSGALTITTTTLPDATKNAAYNQTLAASGGTTPYTWSLSSGAIPDGLVLNATTGVITGTPTAASATSTFTVKVTDSASPAATATQPLAIPMQLSITTATLPNAPTGFAYSQKIVSGGTTPYVFSNVSIPPGLSLSTTTGMLSGTPTSVFDTTAGTGSYTFNLSVTDASNPALTAGPQLFSFSVPTIGRMYDSTRKVFAENILVNSATATQTTLNVTFGNSDTIAHNLLVHVGAFDKTSGAQLSAQDLTVTNDPASGAIPPNSSLTQARSVSYVHVNSVWRILKTEIAP